MLILLLILISTYSVGEDNNILPQSDTKIIRYERPVKIGNMEVKKPQRVVRYNSKTDRYVVVIAAAQEDQPISPIGE